MKEFGFKKLDENNWLKSDIEELHRVLPNNSTRPILPREWIDDIQKSKLDDSTPFEIQKLFEVAKGTMIYGYFFYPILTLSSEQFTRVAETAINIKCNTINCPKARNTFSKKVDWLLQESILSKDLHTKWKSIVKLSNMFSHPSRQNIFNPVMAINLMDTVARNINYLFSKD